MASRATGGTFAAFLISGAILGFAGGALLGTQADGAEPGGNPNTSASTPADAGTGATEGGEPGTDPGATEPEASEEPAGDGQITLAAAKDTVASNERIDITGTIDPPEEGVRLQLQRSVDGGDFEDFPIDAWETDADGAFGGYVQSSRSGENAFRVVMVDDPSIASEPITVQID